MLCINFINMLYSIDYYLEVKQSLNSCDQPHLGFPGGSPAKSGDVGSIPWLERSTGKGTRKAFQYSSGKCHGQRSLVGYGPWSYRRVRQVLATKQQQQKAPLSQRHIIFFIYCSIQLANILLRLLLLLLFSHPVVSYSLQHHGLQQPRPPCPSSSSRVLPSLCSLHQ